MGTLVIHPLEFDLLRSVSMHMRKMVRLIVDRLRRLPPTNSPSNYLALHSCLMASRLRDQPLRTQATHEWALAGMWVEAATSKRASWKTTWSWHGTLLYFQLWWYEWTTDRYDWACGRSTYEISNILIFLLETVLFKSVFEETSNLDIPVMYAYKMSALVNIFCHQCCIRFPKIYLRSCTDCDKPWRNYLDNPRSSQFSIRNSRDIPGAHPFGFTFQDRDNSIISHPFTRFCNYAKESIFSV